MKVIMKRGARHDSQVTNPLFGLALSILAYLIGMLIFLDVFHIFDNASAQQF